MTYKEKNNLFILRTNEKLTQSELASVIGTTYTTISSIEHGTTPESKYIPLIAGLFGVSTETLLSTDRSLIADKLPKVSKRTVKQPKKAQAFKPPKDRAPKPMFAARPIEKIEPKVEIKVEPVEPKVETKTEPEVKQKVDTRAEAQTDATFETKDIVQIITCTAKAANKYLANGWVLLNSRVEKESGDFLVLLGTNKIHTSEDFEKLRAQEKVGGYANYYSGKDKRGV